MPILPACRLVLYKRTVVWVAALVWNPFRAGPACLPDALTGMVTRGRRVGASQASLPVALASRIYRGLLFAADGASAVRIGFAYHARRNRAPQARIRGKVERQCARSKHLVGPSRRTERRAVLSRQQFSAHVEGCTCFYVQPPRLNSDGSIAAIAIARYVKLWLTCRHSDLG